MPVQGPICVFLLPWLLNSTIAQTDSHPSGHFPLSMVLRLQGQLEQISYGNGARGFAPWMGLG